MYNKSIKSLTSLGFQTKGLCISDIVISTPSMFLSIVLTEYCVAEYLSYCIYTYYFDNNIEFQI